MLSFSPWLLQESAFSFSQFLNRIEHNLAKIYAKIKAGNPFQLEDGTQIKLSGLAIKENDKPVIAYKVKFHSEKTWIQLIRNFIEDQDFNMEKDLKIIIDDNNVTPTLKPLSLLSKTEEFALAGKSTKNILIQDTAWGHLLSLPNFKPNRPGKAIEIFWISRFNEKFLEILEDHQLTCCNLQLNQFLIKDVVGVMGASEEKDPKADIVFVNKQEELIGYTSLKSGNKISEFHQWGGLSQLKHAEIDRFIKNLKKYLASINAEGVPEKTSIYSEIKNNLLKNKFIWGADYSSTLFGPNNVEYIIQGDPQLTFSANKVHLRAHHIITRKTKNIISVTSPYRPVLLALYRKGRSDFGFTNTRIFAYPFGGRKMQIQLVNQGFFKENSKELIAF